MEAIDDLDLQLGMLREYYYSGKTRDASWRRSQLKGILSLLKEREDELFRALHQDLGKHPVEAYRDEIGCLIKSVNYALDCLSQWMSGRKAKLPRAALLTSAEIIPEPLGLVLIISSWNFPFGLSLEPLIGALAAGNVAVLKPSESAPASSSLLANLIPVYLDNKAVNVVEGGPDVGQQLLHKKWDKIFFTGSTKIGRAVMAAASENLTPVTLELGGKCPAVIDSLTRSLDREVELMKGMMKKMFGENPKESGSIARIVNKRHLQRLKSLLDDPLVKASIVHGGSMDEDSLYIEPTILLDPPTKAAIMVDEIFGPLLPIITLNKIEDSINFINSRPKPLAIYGFTNNESLKTRMISQTSSGSLTFNDAVIQYAADTLPFGGIGESGMGKYHGKFSFDTFSHQKAVLRRSFLIDFWFRFPPWNDYKLQLFRAMYGFNYLLLLLITLGLKRSK
ncbi:aldehyde dehydrogenase family 3 member F1-like isoform X2 [Punica granatum]|uniref:Aldehyde dehydrogenase n=1 Tax=Punica granatum TaxID=22663 RepID=A0A6P8CM35_PUNGR|nr:aldehyde dehydrogenase family 3 member F1-like isoform X2 [Punica granatum]